MTDPGSSANNVATGSAQVDVQVGVVHGGFHYTPSADASPREKFEMGVHFLDGGVPKKAWPLIDEAFTANYRTNQACFYWLLALVSGRTRNQLSDAETAMLENRRQLFRLTGDDAWADGVRVTDGLLDSVEGRETDPRILFKEFDKLRSEQSALILKHLELFLDGPLRDNMWARALTQARDDQLDRKRADRVWKFFEPDPTAPRPSPVRPPEVSVATRVRALVVTAVFALTAIYIGYLLVHMRLYLGLSAYLLSVPGGYLVARDGVEWRFRVMRRNAKDELWRRRPRPRTTGARLDGFAWKVAQEFDHYFGKYVPDGDERQAWLTKTAGLRKSLRDETAEVYRESRVGVQGISWLIRHLAADVKTRWEKGTLLSYRTELAVPPSTRVRTLLGLVALTGGAVSAVGSAVLTRPSAAAPSAALVLASGWPAVRTWLHIALERRRYDADVLESEQELARRTAAFERWRAKLADKPADRELVAWLDCDRKVLLNEALEHYKLSMSDVIAYAFIEAPATTATSRARVRGGPWRYQMYELLVFLLTNEGVRQVRVRLDFFRGTFHDRQRTNYRFEAVAAVQVSHTDDDERIFELALVNGQQMKVQVIGPGMEQLQQGENPGDVSEMTLDAAGLNHTLHVLEGIAAEGKPWIIRENRRGQARG